MLHNITLHYPYTGSFGDKVHAYTKADIWHKKLISIFHRGSPSLLRHKIALGYNDNLSFEAYSYNMDE